MKDFSEKQDFEKAMELRDEITALEKLQERQNVERQRSFDQDVLAYAVEEKMST